ncbi:hypothetical protein SEA_OHMYWARD_26 [Gordonia phage OhMyWard]|uniref:Uncharacterized protein n=1 Tax=Gordonia phage OhMyWard TaxID=2652414 RepID=A0A5P8D7F0_9CAUD|nr:hypothetical protein HWC72_gp26 [Gordonia phage OhMyWard]QFP94908.1 hypothetical protein SEA_OHMYWARD_26 [Gordonia phage OhMyWard]WNM72406.1 hypothetical protein SEA_MOSSY_27 [Gordonia phage Mossy]
MLQLRVVLEEYFDEKKNEFIEKTHVLRLEHSLVSLSKWEEKFEKPFLSKEEKSTDEIFAYVQMMDLDENTPPLVYLKLSPQDYEAINTHINAKKTATWFTKPENKKKSTQTITSELIYYWMTSYEIPWVAENWHLNRLFTLIDVFNEERRAAESKTGGKSVNKQTRTKAESIAAERRALNEQRRQQLNTTG